MYKKDFLQRQFEEFGKVLATLFKLRKNRELEVYEKEFYSAWMKHSAIAPSQIEAMAQETFVETFKKSGDHPQDQLQFMADLLYDRFELCLEQDNQIAAEQLREKCLYLYSLLVDHATQNEFHLGNHYRVKILKERF